MQNICEWFCPKVKKQEGTYDVHEATFQIEDDIGETQVKIKNSESFDHGHNKNSKSSSHHKLSLNIEHKEQIKQNENKQNEPKKENILPKQSKSGKTTNENKRIKDIRSYQQNLKPQQVNLTSSPRPVFAQRKPNQNVLVSQKQLKNEEIAQKSIKNNWQKGFKDEQNSFKVRIRDQQNNQTFIIRNCSNGKYFIFNLNQNAQVSNCSKCFIFFAPIKNQIVLKNCRNIRIVCSASSIQLENCQDCHLSILTKTETILKDCSSIFFSCFECPQYNELKKQINESGLSVWENHWSQVCALRAKEGQNSYYFVEGGKFGNQSDWKEAFKKAQIEMVNKKQKIAPFIHGQLSITQNCSPALLIFSVELQKVERSILEWINEFEIHLLKPLVRGKEQDELQDEFKFALLFDNKDQFPLKVEVFENAQLVVDENSIEEFSKKYLQSFNYEI